MKRSLVIMAAGIGSRYGGGIKQLATVDSQRHIIMDYSIHDAIKAGFTKIIFVIRRDIEAEFRSVIGNRIEEICRRHQVTVCYAFQSSDDLPEGFSLPEGRTKPWGTGHAVLAAKKFIDEPFVVINADDYYGQEAYRRLADFLESSHKDTDFAMAGFVLKNTLSESGGVTRGLCTVDDTGYLRHIEETPHIERRLLADGSVSAVAEGRTLDADGYVSMNMWGLTPAFLTMLEEGFVRFLSTAAVEQPTRAEYLLPIFIGELLKQEAVTVKVLPTGDQWFGVTYLEDKKLVEESFAQLLREGRYTQQLFDDL